MGDLAGSSGAPKQIPVRRSSKEQLPVIDGTPGTGNAVSPPQPANGGNLSARGQPRVRRKSRDLGNGSPPKERAPKEGDGLLKEMAALMQGASDVIGGAKTTQDGLKRERRKSKDLEESLDKLAAAADAWNALGGSTSRDRSRRNSRDYKDEELKQAASPAHSLAVPAHSHPSRSVRARPLPRWTWIRAA